MTSPYNPPGVRVKPGPFSFLGGAGEALGAFAQQREQMRQQRQMEARQAAAVLIGMREKGLIGPDAFSDPNVQQIFAAAGYGTSPSTEPTAGERLDALKKRYLTALGEPGTQTQIPGSAVGGADTSINVPATAKFTAEQRAAVGAPQRSALLGEQAAATATAATLPEVGAQATAGAQSAQDKTFNEIADRVVESLYNRNGKMPTPAEAFLVGKYDPRASVFGPRINETYYGAAVERLRAKLEAEKTTRTAAQARAAAAAKPVNIPLLNQLNRMVTQADSKIEDLSKPVNMVLSGDQGKQILTRLQEQRDALQSAASQVAAGIADEAQIRELLNVAGKSLLEVPQTGKTLRMSPALIEKNAKIALRLDDPEASLEADVKAGRLSKEDKAAILKKMQEIAK